MILAATQAGPSLSKDQKTDGSATAGGRSPTWSDSQEVLHLAWDDFLRSARLGHFQQSSRWAQAKAAEGWEPIRRILTLDGRICGGFQILARRTRFGRIGYISKGPVLVEESSATINSLLPEVKRAAEINALHGLVVQPPDLSEISGVMLANHGLLPNHVIKVIKGTLLADLSPGIEEVGRHFRKNTWVEIRQAQRRGITIREGTEQDLPDFFRLMLATCERQQTKPSPATLAALLALWEALHPSGNVRLSIAQYAGEPIAAALCICFGSRVTIWKKGWSGAHRDRHPNSLLVYEAIDWSIKNGYKLFDFAALAPDIAMALLQGAPLSESQRKSRDFVHLSYGKRPVLLPEDGIYIPNSALRCMYRVTMGLPALRSLTTRLIGV